jgi:DNA-binding transcriptional LysR family regulator
MNSVELRHLRYFTAVAEALNFSKAAAKLHVAQPALSRQVRDLEEELGVLLLERGPRGVSLTAAGRAFAPEAQAILDHARRAMEAARAAAGDGAGEIHVGYAPSPAVELLPRALHAFQNDAPDTKVSLHDLSSEEMLRGLREKKLDVALMVRPSAKNLRGLVFKGLARYPIRVAVGPRHALARRSGAVTLKDLAGEHLHVYARAEYPEYHEWLAAVFAAAGLPFKFAHEHDGASSLIAAVEAGKGAALAPSCMACLAGGRIKFLELEPAQDPLVVGVAWRTEDLSPAASRFVTLLRKL